MSTFGSQQVTSGIAPNDCNVPQAGNDGISSLIWSPIANFLVSSNWDSGIRCWEVIQEQSGLIRANPKAQVNHEANSAVLDSCFSMDGSTVFSVGTDKAVRMWRLGEMPPNNVAQQIGVHDAPAKSVGFLSSSKLVVSGGWDRKLKFWDTRSPNPAGVLEMPERVYDLDVKGSMMVVATGNRQLLVYNVGGPQPIEHSNRDSPLKFQTRCVSCFPDQTGFAVGGIEGRVGIQQADKNSKDHFAFKCHRQDQNVFSVNAIAFQNQFGTFATVGSDGVVNFWDKDNKQRLKAFTAVGRPIPCAAFNVQGNFFAYASSYDWSKGSQFYAPGTPNEIFIHYTPEDEIKPKGKRR